MPNIEKATKVDGHTLTLTNLDKVYWPDIGITKGELMAYYNHISKYILPHLKDRPESLNRFPDGIEGSNFFQKNITNHPKWLKTFTEVTGEKGKAVTYAVANNRAALSYLVNLGTIELNVWSSRVGRPEEPDFLIFDLDPVEIDFDEVRRAALAIKESLDSVGIKSYPKTSGKSGLHIYTPLELGYTFDQVRDFAYLVALGVHKQLPETTSLERQPAKRQGKVYIDYLQNRKGATMTAPYSVRPVKGATVSAPLRWEEVKNGVYPSAFTIKNMPERLDKIGDIFKPVLGRGVKLELALKKLARIA